MRLNAADVDPQTVTLGATSEGTDVFQGRIRLAKVFQGKLTPQHIKYVCAGVCTR